MKLRCNDLHLKYLQVVRLTSNLHTFMWSFSMVMCAQVGVLLCTVFMHVNANVHLTQHLHLVSPASELNIFSSVDYSVYMCVCMCVCACVHVTDEVSVENIG